MVSPVAKRRSASRAPFSAIMLWPVNTRSVVDSPSPASAYTYPHTRRPDCPTTRLRRYPDLPTSSLEADRFRITVAPPRASRAEGGSVAHRSSQISTPRTRLGTFSQAKSPAASMSTVSPHRSTLVSTPAPEANHRCS